jgi:membrane-associated HD superfamily phosphohydrolase
MWGFRKVQNAYMCDKNIVAKTYYDGGTSVATTTNIEKMTRTAQEMAEAQRDSYEALMENLAATQRRGVGLAQDGLGFIKLQEENAKAAQQWFASSVRLAQLQQRNAGCVQDWLREGAEALREQTEHNVRTAEAFARSARKQQEGFRALAQGWTGAYEGFFFSPFNYAQEGLRTLQQATDQGLKATQRVVEQGTEATEQIAHQGLRVAEEATEQTEEILRKTGEAALEVELRASVLSALQTDNYEGMTVAEITEKLDDLSAEELKKLREFEKRTKDRESLVERIDRKIRANS